MDDRATGALLGLACGDALGRPVEFRQPSTIRNRHGRVTEMLADGTHGQPAGTITDDTEMALCIARSLTTNDVFVPADIARRFIDWYQSGPFDVGLLTAAVIQRLQDGEPWHQAGYAEWERRPEGSNAGNGSVMRCAPHSLAFATDLDTLITVSRASSAITHADPRCQWGCAILNVTLAGLLTDVDEPLARALAQTTAAPAELRQACEEVLAVTRGDQPPDTVSLDNSGYVVTTVQAGLYHGLTASTAEEAIISAVMMGGDTDPLAAVTGAVAGARFGASALPTRWQTALDTADELTATATSLTSSAITCPYPVRERIDTRVGES